MQTILLARTSDALFVERPTGPDGAIEPAAGQETRITFQVDQQRYRLDAAVRGSRNYTIEPDVTANAIELDSPRRVCELQRRADYRIPLWGSTPVIAHFEPSRMAFARPSMRMMSSVMQAPP